jgi:hypothetical protein
MKSDPIVEEVHRIREAIAKRNGNDLHSMCEEARKAQKASGRKAVRPTPRRPLAKAAK